MSERRDAARGLSVAQITIGGLLLGLHGRMAEVFAGVSLETKTGRRAPTVLLFDLPPKPAADAEQFPFVVVRPMKGADSVEASDQNATAVLEIVVGTYSDTDDGGIDVLSLIDAVRLDIGAQPEIPGTGYAHIGPLTWETPAQQPRPQWFGFINTIWQIPRPRRVEARNPMED